MNYNAKRASGWRRLVGGIAFLSVLLSGAVTGQERAAAALGPHAEGEFASAPALVPTQAQKRFPLSQMPAQIVLDRVTPARLNTETAAQPGKPGVPFKIGFSRDLLSLKNRAQTLAQLTWQSLPSGQIAALSVSSPEALGVRLGLLIENIPATTLLRFYAQKTDQVFEISGRTIMESVARNLAVGDTSDEARTYWSPLIDGPEITVEIELPTGVSPDEVMFSIPRLSHLFVSPLNTRAWQEKIGQSGSCNLNSTCYSATWGNESLATARMAFNSGGGSYLCTGTLLNDSDASTVVPYFLSANHCISTQSEASSLQTYWFYRASSCNSTSLSSSTQTLVGGATLLYASSLTDTSFMRLNSTPPAGAWYSAWTASLPSLNTAVTGIHNPSGDLQKISFATITGYLNCPTTPGSSSYSCSSATSSSADHLKLVWNQGITEGGSSGSGLWLAFGSNHYLVGQLHGGSSDCLAPTAPDNYGRFDVAYNTALYQWLGATGTSAYALTVSKSGSGTVTSADGGINCGSACSASFTSGAQVTLTATPAIGSTFTGWSGACSGTSTICTLAMNAVKSVTASFSAGEGAGYTDNGDGSVTDPRTGLIWMRCAMGQTWTGSTCSGMANSFTWDQAAAMTGSTSFAGHNDWRLPNIRELVSIVDRSLTTPTLDRGAFPNAQGSEFWSSTAYTPSPTHHWDVLFLYGNTTHAYPGLYNYVRLVRGGQVNGLLNPARPTSDYVDQGNGSTMHTPSGLTWKHCAEGQTWSGSACSGTASFYTWAAAQQLTGTFAGNSDWRLPTVEELLSLVDYTVGFPALNRALFPLTPPSRHFWSASAYKPDLTFTWYVDFETGNAGSDYPSAGYNNARLVRSSQTSGAFALSVTATGSGSGTITGNAINCASTAGVTSGTCSANLASGTAVTLSAAPASGSTFSSWNGCDSISGATCTVTMNAAKNVIAAFAAPTSSRYTKIANNGADLSASAVLGSGATQWACTRDNTTGLVWEVKTTNGGLRDWNKSYTNYDSSYGVQAQIDAATNSIGFTNAVNSGGLCGTAGWRMPSEDELLGLMNISYTPTIDSVFFPNTLSSDFWSGSPNAYGSSVAVWVNFRHGYVGYEFRYYSFSVRLVHGGQPVGTFALTVSATGSGTIASNAGGINCTSTAGAVAGACSADLASGSAVILSAAPATGSTFTSWNGCDSTSGTTCTVTMNAAKNVIAAFAVASSRYTKIANNGADLPASAVLGSGATQWACTRDNTTGLVWEVKTTDGGLRDLNKTYTNYDDPTQPQKSNGSSVTNPTQAEIDAASNSIGFLNAVNSSRLCGSSGWWMPSRDELFGLINNVYTPMIDPTFFPNTLSANFWSGSLDLDYPHYAWYVCFTHGNCMYGNLDRFYDQSIRLVNNGQSLLRPQTILFSNPPNLFTVGGTASLRASASSSLPVTISSSTPNICTHTGNTVRGEAVGLCYLMANQAGNVNFSPAPQAGIGFYIDMASVLPGAPTITSFVAESRRATIHFSPPSNTGGSPIALYTATCAASGQTARLATGTVSPLTVINLTGGVTYQCTLTATNSGGSSSTASGAVSVTAKKSSITPILMLLLD